MKYSEKLVFLEYSKILEKRIIIIDVVYNLKVVIVYEGENILVGYYICYFKRGEIWYYLSDIYVYKLLVFEVIS